MDRQTKGDTYGTTVLKKVKNLFFSLILLLCFKRSLSLNVFYVAVESEVVEVSSDGTSEL